LEKLKIELQFNETEQECKPRKQRTTEPACSSNTWPSYELACQTQWATQARRCGERS